jgi:hypothetical protein
MTKIKNRATRVHARRLTALTNLKTDPKRADDEAYVATKRAQREVLVERTSTAPQITHTRKFLRTGTEARKAHRAGKGI